MGIFDRIMGGPTEPSAAERATAADLPACAACRTVTGLPTIRIALADHGHANVCADPVTCRMRAQTAGIWGVA